VFNLEEFMNNEFLRPRENKCKWFNTYGVMWKWVYIEGKWKSNFSSKINYLNRFIKCLNRFRQFDSKLSKRKRYKDWYVSCRLWINSKETRMEIDTTQSILNPFNIIHKCFVRRVNQFWVESKVKWFKVLSLQEILHFARDICQEQKSLANFPGAMWHNPWQNERAPLLYGLYS